MPASNPLYHDIHAQITRCCDPVAVPGTAAERLALLVTGVIAAQSCVQARVAAELDALALTEASTAESIGRRLRRTLNDAHLTWDTCYRPLVSATLDWTSAVDAAGRLVLILDESSHTDHVHLLRVSLPYRGGSLPLAWALWEQNVALPDGAYWRCLDVVLDQVTTLVPPHVEVVVLADRAYAVPAMIDRLTVRGWHWIVRLTTGGSLRFWPERGEETTIREVVERHLDQPGRRWRARGQVFKNAGWRAVRLVGMWGVGATEPLVVITDLPADWSILDRYGQRFWIEAGFRSDKSRGWHWETCQVRGVTHHAVLLLVLAWASLLVLCRGAAEATRRIHHLAQRPPRRHGTQWRTAKPQPARESLFTLGLRQVRRALYATRGRHGRWHLPDLAAPSWTDQWRSLQSHRFLFALPVRS